MHAVYGKIEISFADAAMDEIVVNRVPDDASEPTAQLALRVWYYVEKGTASRIGRAVIIKVRTQVAWSEALLQRRSKNVACCDGQQDGTSGVDDFGARSRVPTGVI